MCWIFYTNICGGDSGIVLSDDGHLCETVIPENIYIKNNNIPKMLYLVLSYIQIGGTKFRIYSRKK